MYRDFVFIAVVDLLATHKDIFAYFSSTRVGTKSERIYRYAQTFCCYNYARCKSNSLPNAARGNEVFRNL